MLKSIEAQGTTRDEAIENALRQLGMDRDSVSVEVLDNGKKGFLGIGATPARVRVSYEAPDEAPVRHPEPVQKPISVPKKAEPARTEPVRPAEVKPVNPAGEAPAAPEEEAAEAPAPVAASPLDEGQIPPVGREAVKFIDGLLEKLGIDGHAVVLDTTAEDHVQIEIVGPDMGPVIGRRGDTLDAIQYLSSLVANRISEEHVRVSIDTENYRAKRAESLTRLARKMAGKVTRYHKSMTLEPMNPYERRIIHSALQDYKGVTTYSTGTEPGRRVVIAPEGRTGGARSGGYSSYGGHKSGR